MVQDSNGPVAGVELWLVPLDGSVPAGTPPSRFRQSSVILTTDERGAADLPSGLRGPLLVHVEHSGYGWAEQQWDVGKSGPLRFQLTKTCGLTGHVVTSQNEIIPDAIARRRRKAHGNENTLFEQLLLESIEEIAECDQKGRFGFSMVDSRQQVVDVTAKDYVPVHFFQVDPDQHLTVVLTKPATLLGTVRDDSGHAVPGVEVRIWVTGVFPEELGREVVTDLQGRFEVTDSPSGQLAIGFVKDGYAIGRLEMTVPPSSTKDASYTMQNAVSIKGQVLRRGGGGVGGTQIDVIDESLGVIVNHYFTDPNGRFEVLRTARGRPYQLQVGATPATTLCHTFGVLGGSENVTIVVDCNGRLSGKVTFADQGVAQILFRQIRLDRNTQFGTQDQQYMLPWPCEVKDGRYSTGAFPGLIDVEATAEGYAPLWVREVQIPPTGGEVRLDLHFAKGFTLSVRAGDKATAKPLAGATVTTFERCHTGNYVRGASAVEVVTNEQGLATLDNIPESLAAVRVSAHGMGTALVLNPLEKASGVPPLLDIDLELGGAIEGVVDVPYAAPETAVTVYARPVGFEEGMSATVDHERHYLIEGLPPGPVEVRLEDLFYTQRFQNAALPSRQVIVHAGETTRVDWQGMAGAQLNGEVHGFDGTAVIHAYELLDGDQTGGLAGGAHTDLEHRFRVPGMRPGRYLLVGRSGEVGKSLSVSQSVEIKADEREHSVVLDVAQKQLTGTVSRASGEPLARSTIELYSEPVQRDLAEAVVIASPDGSFSITGLGDGTYALLAAHPGYGTVLLPGLRAPADLGTVALEREATFDILVEDDRHEPVRGAVVQALSRHCLGDRPREAYVNPQGSVGLSALAVGRWAVSAAAPHHASAGRSIEAEAGRSEQLTITLVRLSTLIIQAHDPSGAPLTREPIVVTNEQGEELGHERPLVTDAEGKLVVVDLLPGTYTILHERLQLERDVTLRPGEAVEIMLGSKHPQQDGR